MESATTQALGSVSKLISDVKDGNNEAARLLWTRYAQQLLGYSKTLIGKDCNSVADEEDVVVATFDSVFRRLAKGAFPMLVNRNGLWKLLLRAAKNKATDQWRHFHRECRRPVALKQTSVIEVAPDAQAEFVDMLQYLLQRLPTDEMRRICILRLDGYTNVEISQTLNCSLATIERRLALVRDYWRAKLTYAD